ncbi:aldo/keto reductase [Aegicerativicinus sediminis]
MNYRQLGDTDLRISEISLGTWQVGGKWGEPFSHKVADDILNEAIDNGINFIDTADVYSDGESEKAVGKIVRQRRETIYVATKCGRQLQPHINEKYTIDSLKKFVDESLKRLGLEKIDLIQLHCPPNDVYYRPEIFQLFDDLKKQGKIGYLGVSVEKVEQAIKAIEFPNVKSVQIIFNMFRQRPNERFFKMAKEKGVGVIVRVPLASGLLTGKFSKESSFGKDDHRNFNREGAAFDKGETFSGIPFEVGLEAVDQLKSLFPNVSLSQLAIKWILQNPDISTVIPGASNVQQVTDNIEALKLKDLNSDELSKIDQVYGDYIKRHVHQLW